MSLGLVFWREPEQSRSQQVPRATCRSRSKAIGRAPATARASLLIVMAAAAMLAGAGCNGEKPQVAAASAPTSVAVVKATQMDIPVHAEWVATLEGYVNAVIQPQVGGYLISQNY